VEGIQHALNIGLNCTISKLKPKFRIIAAPLFQVYTETLKKNNGIILLEEILEVMKKALSRKGGTLEIKEKPSNVESLYENIKFK